MSILRKDRELPTSTRDRLIQLLREEPRPVEELAGMLGVTPNAVRSQLTILERDGLVRAMGERRGRRRPSHTFGLTPEGGRHLSRAYPPVLRAVLEATSARGAPEEVEELLREAGRRLAAGFARPRGDLRTRAAKALQILEDLGSSVELEETQGRLILRGHGCPLEDAVEAEPQMCKCMESFLSELVGARVDERCRRGDRAQCLFEISPPEGELLP